MGNKQKGALLSLLTVDRKNSIPIYKQLENQIRRNILQGVLKSGIRLPSSRVLAIELNISRPTVTQVIGTLVSEGFLETIHGSGTFVASDLPKTIPTKLPNTPSDTLSEKNQAIRLSKMGAALLTSVPNMVPRHSRPLLPNYPAFDLFPHTQWQKCLIRQSRKKDAVSMGYGNLMGHLPLRENLADYLNVHRGANCSAEQILITSGGHFSFTLALLLLTEENDKIWFEDPGAHVTRSLFEAFGRTLVDIDVDKDGMMVDYAIQHHPDAAMAFVMPSRQHPLGTTLSLPRRLALLDWATKNNSWILEDDYDSEFRYKGRPLASISSIDQSGRVIYSGTFSKSMHPSLRIGYLVLPKQLIIPFQNATGLMVRSIPTGVQAALAEFIERGYFATHIRRMKNLYGERREALLSLSTKILGNLVEIDVPDSGMNIIYWLKPNQDDQKIAKLMEQHGIVIYPMSDYRSRPHYRPGLILGFTSAPAEEIVTPLNQLKTILLTNP